MSKIKEKISHFLRFTQDIIPSAIWRILVNLWSMAALVVFTYEFMNGNPHPDLNIQLTIIYIGVLTIYVGSKEFRRWNNLHLSTRYGEIYVLVWTALMITFALLAIFNPNLHVSADLAATYIAVLSIFALTRQSKLLHQKTRNQQK